MIRRHPGSQRTNTLFPSTPLFRSPKAPARARSAPKAAAGRKGTPKPPAKKPEKARATGKGGVVQEVRQFRVQSDDDGIRLDRWFKRHLPDVGFNIVSRWARTGQLRVDGARYAGRPGRRRAGHSRAPRSKGCSACE